MSDPARLRALDIGAGRPTPCRAGTHIPGAESEVPGNVRASLAPQLIVPSQLSIGVVDPHIIEDLRLSNSIPFPGRKREQNLEEKKCNSRSLSHATDPCRLTPGIAASFRRGPWGKAKANTHPLVKQQSLS
jgi:hypothetical protein